MIRNKLLDEKRVTIGLILCFLLSLPLKNNINSIFIFLISTYAAINFFILNKRKFVFKFSFKNVEFYFVIYYFILIISILYSENTQIAIKHVGRYIPFLILPLGFSVLPSLEMKKKCLIRKFYVYWIAIILIFLFCNAIRENAKIGYSFIDFIVSFSLNLLDSSHKISGLEYWVFMYEGLTGILGIQPIYMSLFVNLAFVFLISLKEKKEIKPITFWILCFLFLIFSILLSSRMGTLLFLSVFFTYLILYEPKTKRQFFRNILIFASCFILMFTVVITNPILKDRIMSVIDTKYTNKYVSFANQNIRMVKWSNAIEVIKKSPIIGFGVGDYKEILIDQYEESNFLLGVKNRYNSHNQYLDTTIQLGVFGLSALLGLFLIGIIKSYKKDLEKVLIYSTFALSLLTESMFDRHWGLVSFVFFICFSLKYNVDINNNKYEDSNLRNQGNS